MLDPALAALRWTELNRANFPAFREWLLEPIVHEEASVPRTYPGYPRWELPAVKPRTWCALDKQLMRRRSSRSMGSALPKRATLSRWFTLAHGVTASDRHGPVPSAGGLQALELYLVTWTAGWLPAGVYHFDRRGRHLSQVADRAERSDWQARVPSLEQIEGGTGLLVVVGESSRVVHRYGPRGGRFLLLEAGHLLQNLSLLATSLDLAFCALGGVFEGDVAAALGLPQTDWVLYAAVWGSTFPARRAR